MRCRMEGFKDPWESAVHKGRLVPPDKTLQDCGLASGSELITVRRVLVPESEALAPTACGPPAWPMQEPEQHACLKPLKPLPGCCACGS